MDVDGVLTDGTITWGSFESAPGDSPFVELKSFNVRDGLGIGTARVAGLDVAWVTGRVSNIVQRRAEELGVREVVQRARDKRAALHEIAARLGMGQEQVLYIGDDLNDLPAFQAAGVRVAVADASPMVRDAADWITDARGGDGAVREVIEAVLQAQGQWQQAVAAFLEHLEAAHTANQ